MEVIDSDDLIIATLFERYWEVDQKKFGKLFHLKDSHGQKLLIKNDFDNDYTLLGYKLKKVEKRGMRLIFNFSDKTTHVIEIKIREIE